MTLLGATGTGKTATMAFAVEKLQLPTLVIAQNKTLAAQLCNEFREFFPDNAVEYFVSLLRLLPARGVPPAVRHVHREGRGGQRRHRPAAPRGDVELLTRKDVLIVASVSCIYGLGSPDEYQEQLAILRVGEETWKRLPEDVRSKTIDPVLEYFLGVHSNGGTAAGGGTIKDHCDAQARKLLEDPTVLALFKPIAEALKDHIGPVKKNADDACRTALGIKDKAADDEAKPPDADAESHAYLGYYYQNYDEYDRIIFPIIYGTEIGEAAKVDIVRISPEDATALINERETGCYKLAGTALGHFGAFLDPLWRRNDIMWGRLDGAERIITALLPNDRELARHLVGEAHAAIVHEAIARIGANEAKDLICEAGMRTRSGNAEPNLITQFIDNLKLTTVQEHSPRRSTAKLTR